MIKILIHLLCLLFLVSCVSQKKDADIVADNVIKEVEKKDRSKYLKLGYDYYFYQGYKNFIEAIEPQFFYDGIMHSNQSKVDMYDSHSFIMNHFGLKPQLNNPKVKERIDAFYEGKKVARIYLKALKSDHEKKDFLMKVEEIRNNLKSHNLEVN